MNRKHKSLKRMLLVASAIVIIVLSFAGCSSSGPNKGSEYNPGNTEGTVFATNGITERKITYEARISLESKDIEKTAELIKAKVREYAAVEGDSSRIDTTDSSSSGYYSLTLRITTEKLDEFMDYIGDNFKVKAKRVSSEDLSAQYYNYQAEEEAIATEIQMLQDAMKDANVDQVFRYTQRIAELGRRRNEITKAMGIIDERVILSTVYVTVYGSGKTPLEDKYTDQVGKVFVGSLRALATAAKYISLGVVAILPFAAIGGGVFGVVILVKRKRRLSNTRKGDSSPQEDNNIDKE